ncbi:MAG: citrate lyase subunit alpha [Bacillota bacterium]|jgi:citrate lyase subunit alpha/citrate CoA-transferase
MNKVVKSLREAIILSGLQSGMTISFHHNLRAGDTIAVQIINEICSLGIKDIRIAPTSLLSGHDPIGKYIENRTITRIESSGFTPLTGKVLQQNFLKEVALLRTHGGRAQDIEKGNISIDVAFIAVSRCDKNGNCTGSAGKSAFGSLGYSIMDARYAKKVIVVTDELSQEPIYPISIDQTYVNYVVEVDNIGDPSGIVSTSTKISADPVNLKIAKTTAEIIGYSGYLMDGFCFQAGASGISLAVIKYLEKIMLDKGISGRFGMGGITAGMVEMLNKGLFKVLYDTQTFDLPAIESLRQNLNHIEVSASMYANPEARGGCLVNELDCVVLGATEIDTDFNVNVHTDSNNRLISGAGGHGDTAEGAKMTIITAPSFRSRIPTIVDRVNTISTPGKYVDVYVSQRGVAINTSIPKNAELAYRLKNAGIPIVDIHDLKKDTERITGKPDKVKKGDRTVAKIIWRDGSVIDEIKSLSE